MRPRRMSFLRGTKDCPLAIYPTRDTKQNPARPISHWHPQMEFFHVKQGSYSLIDLRGEHIFTSGDLVIIPPETIHAVHGWQAGSEKLTINFDLELISVPPGHFFYEEFLRPLREGYLQLPRCLHPQDPGYAQAMEWLRFLDGAKRDDPGYKGQVFMGAMGLCVSLMPLCKRLPAQEAEKTGSRGNDTVRLCQTYIGQNYARQITLEELAEYVHVHPNYLCRIFKEYAGQPIFEYINSIRISFATQFIRNSTDPLPEIAERCGFRTMRYFIKRFKQHTGVTPHAYSKLYKNR